MLTLLFNQTAGTSNASAAVTLDPLTSSATATNAHLDPRSAAAAVTLDALTSSATATVASPRNASVAVTLADLTSSATIANFAPQPVTPSVPGVAPPAVGEFRCPTFLESFLATCALWPRGRAWPVSDGLTPVNYLNWLAGIVGIPKAWPTGFVQAGYSAAIAAVRNYIETRLCALRLEFWCATQSETNDQWLIEYGLPDACDPFPDLCTKVAAIGGTRCEYYAAVAARAGWTITCTILNDDCGGSAGNMQTGCDYPGGHVGGATIVIIVDLGNSIAYVASGETQPFAGNFSAGLGLACAPDIGPLKCILDRVVHAHIVIAYQTTGG